MALTDKDLEAFKNLMEVAIDDVFEKKGVATKGDLSHLPNKDEFYEATGEIIKKLDDLEQEKDILSHQVSNHEDRIENIEARLHLSAD